MPRDAPRPRLFLAFSSLSSPGRGADRSTADLSRRRRAATEMTSMFLALLRVPSNPKTTISPHQTRTQKKKHFCPICIGFFYRASNLLRSLFVCFPPLPFRSNLCLFSFWLLSVYYAFLFLFHFLCYLSFVHFPFYTYIHVV